MEKAVIVAEEANYERKANLVGIDIVYIRLLAKF